MTLVSVTKLLKCGVHFGHKTRSWNPKMKKYIFGEKNNVYVINLQETLKGLDKAYDFVKNTANNAGKQNGKILFVGTKKQAQNIIQEEAVRSEMFYINQRWLGGMLTNFETIKKRINYLKDLEKKKESGYFENLRKKEVVQIEKKIAKLTKSLGGIKNMDGLPDAIFIIDPQREHIAIKEAKKLNIPIVSLVDTNCDPDPVDFVIPGNDDALKSIRLMAQVIANAAIEGKTGEINSIDEEMSIPVVKKVEKVAEPEVKEETKAEEKKEETAKA